MPFRFIARIRDLAYGLLIDGVPRELRILIAINRAENTVKRTRLLLLSRRFLTNVCLLLPTRLGGPDTQWYTVVPRSSAR